MKGILPKKYEFLEILQENDNSIVVLANKEGEKVVLKMIPKESVFFNTAFEEYKIIKQINHPNLISVSDSGFIDKFFYYELPFYKKIDPIKYCKEKGEKGFLEIFYQLLIGLDILHKRNILHGDLSFENIFVTKQKDKINVKLSDFGLTSLNKSKYQNLISGTAYYIAPELIISPDVYKNNQQTDIYSLGIYLIILLTGKIPFYSNEVLDIMKEIIKGKNKTIKPIFDVDENIISIIEKMAAYNPVSRFNNVQEVLSAIYSYLIKNKIDISDYSEQFNKISINYYSEKKINLLEQAIKNHKVIAFYKEDKERSIFDFIKAKLSYRGIKTIVIDDIKEDLQNTIKEKLELNFNELHKINNNEKIIILAEYSKIKDELNEKKFLDNKTLIIALPKDFKENNENFTIIKEPKKTVEEYKNYLILKLGKDIVTNDFYKVLYKKCNTDIELNDIFIKTALTKKILKNINFKWQIDLNALNELQLPIIYFKDELKKFEKLSAKEKELLFKIAFWKENFTEKEISQIFNYKLIRLTDYLNKFKALDFIIHTPKYLRFKYGIFKTYLAENCDKELSRNIRKAIVEYLKNIKLQNYDDIIYFMELLKKDKNYNDLVNEGLKYIKNFNDDTIQFKNIARYLYINSDKFIDEIKDKEKIYLIFRNYFYAVALLENLSEMENILNKAKKIFDEKNSEYYYHILALEVTYIRYKSQYKKIIEIYNKVKPVANTFGYDLKKLFFYGVGRAFLHLNQPMDAIEIFRSLLSKIKHSDYDFKIKCYSNIGIALYALNDVTKALESLKMAEIIAKNHNIYNELGKIYLNYGFIYMNEADYEKALKVYKKAEKIMEKHHIKYMEFNINHGLAAISYNLGNSYQALSYIRKVKNEFIKTNARDFYYKLLLNVLMELGYPSVFEYFIDKAIHFASENQINNSLYSFYSIYLHYSLQTEDKPKIKKYLEKVQKYSKYAYVKEKQIGDILTAESYIFLDDFINAQKILDSIQKHNEKRRLSLDLKIRLYKTIAQFYYKKEDFSKAYKEIRKSLEILNTKDDKILIAYEIYYYAYLISKEAFSKGITTDDYKSYLTKAYHIIEKRLLALPNNKMRRSYQSKLIVANILHDYKLEKKTILSDTGSLLLDMLEEISKIVEKVTNKQKLFSDILRIGLKVTKAQRGAIITIDSDTSEPKIDFLHKVREKDAKEDVYNFSKDIVLKVLRKKKAVYYTNVVSNKDFDKFKTFVNLKIESVICLPLIIHKTVLGVIYMDSSNLLAFTPEEIKFLKIFAQIAASVVETSKNYDQLIEKNKVLSKEHIEKISYYPDIIGVSPQMVDLYKKMEQVAKTDVTVLIEGESGTGKELVAKNIYKNSMRKDKPFIAVDCGSLSETLIESELFGHKKGAFTGAIFDKKGIFEEANGGTIFLDEISNISKNMQSKLLRLIQEGEFKRLGENVVRKVNVRIIAATNIPLKELVEKGEYRQDLYYRLSVFPITIPPLRERKDDIPLLASYFLDYYSALYKKNISGFDKYALEILQNYEWKGNVRELQNEIERATILCNESRISKKYFKHLQTEEKKSKSSKHVNDFNKSVDEYKLSIIKKALEQNNNNWSKAAQSLNLTRQSLKRIYDRITNK